MASTSKSIPDLSLQLPTVDFIDNRLDKYHQAFATPPARYDPRTGEFIICEPIQLIPLLSGSSSATFGRIPAGAEPVMLAEDDFIPPRPLAEPAGTLKFWDSLFFRAMEHFKEEHPIEPKALVDSRCRIRDKEDWTSLFDQLESTKQEYCNVDKGFKSGFKKVYRKFAQHMAQPLIGAVKFVPDVDCVTPVLGAVQILLEAARNAAKVREAILGGFDNIDMMFSQVELFLEIFRDDNIKEASVKLISATFHAIECVIGFFVSNLGRRLLGATFKGKDYQETITSSLQAVKDRSQALILEADHSEKYEMSNAMKKILTKTSRWHSKLDHISRGQDIIRHETKSYFNRLISECEANRKALLASSQREENLIGIISTLSRSSSPLPPLDSSQAEQYIDPQEILDWIDIPDLTSQDIQYMEERRQLLVPSHERARAEQLIQVGRMQQWIASPTSYQLLIHGNYDSRRTVSGLSLLCATFFQSLADRAPHLIRLAFFCGRHADGHAGGRAMVQSLICQLLCQFDFAGRLPAAEVSGALVGLGDVEELCRLFEWLVCLLPEQAVVFCLVDGILYYEREEFSEDMAYVLVTILRMSDEQSTPAAVKVLVTSPCKTVDVRKPFPDDLIISMDSLALPGMVASKDRLARVLQEDLLG